jgi:hypothetical protein
MQRVSKALLCLALMVGISAILAQPTFAQQNLTTGTLTGVVSDAQGGVLPGATVVAKHVPTGTTYESVTQGDGVYTMAAVRVGGPYTVRATMNGFKTEEQTEVNVGLGEARSLNFTLQIQAVQEVVTVVSQAQIIDTQRAGTAANIQSRAIEALPTLSRSINDFARTSPFFNVTADAAGNDAFISVAGRNNRYNNMQIDGAINNDVFGLAASGTPGGQTSTQPISLDAIQEIQLVVSPYDVRQGGFSGGGVNAVTKSGTNAFHGTGYYFGRSQKFIGAIPGIATIANPAPADTKVGAFKDRQYGASVGGPIWKNKAFFFTNFDFARKFTPVGFSADGSSGQQWGNQAYVQQIVDAAKTYGYNPGPLSEFSQPKTSDKIFVRGDFNLSPNHQLTVRTNYVKGIASIGSDSTTFYNLQDHYYYMTDKMLSTVAQLNSTFKNVFNEARVTYSRERNNRGGQPGYAAFPEVTVYLPDNTSVSLGTEYSSQANKLNQDIVEITDDVTWVKGGHTFAFGTHNELYKFYNLFIQNLYGSYYFASIADFQAGLARGYYHYFSNTANPNEAANFSVRQFGFYAGDKWRVKNNFTLTYGVRLDLPRFPKLPLANPVAVSDFGYHTDIVPAPAMWSPRAGFNWDISGGKSTRRQIRGGLGFFTGRTPYVWLSNQYGNTGVQFTNLSIGYKATNPTIPFVADVNQQPTSFTGSVTGNQTLNVIDPNYKFPEVIRGNLALDHDLGFAGLVATAELVYTKTVKDILYKNLNWIPTGATLPDGTVQLKKFDTTLNDVMLLTNTNQGSAWQVALKVERPFRNGFYASGSYLYGRAYSINDGTSSVARSNWLTDPTGIDMNNPPLAISNHDPGHRVNFTATFPIPLWKGLRSSASVYYNGQSGRPYSLGFNGDMTGYGTSGTYFQLYVPATSSSVVIYSSTTGQTATWDQLAAFLGSDPSAMNSKGVILPRNNGRAPWNNEVDFRYAINVPTGGKTKAEVTFDVFNFMNLLNKNWGWQYWAPFPGIAKMIGYGGIDATTGLMKLNLSTINSPTFLGTFTRDDLRSRWQAQLGVRFRF